MGTMGSVMLFVVLPPWPWLRWGEAAVVTRPGDVSPAPPPAQPSPPHWYLGTPDLRTSHPRYLNIYPGQCWWQWPGDICNTACASVSSVAAVSGQCLTTPLHPAPPPTIVQCPPTHPSRSQSCLLLHLPRVYCLHWNFCYNFSKIVHCCCSTAAAAVLKLVCVFVA